MGYKRSYRDFLPFDPPQNAAVKKDGKIVNVKILGFIREDGIEKNLVQFEDGTQAEVLYFEILSPIKKKAI